jgi:hypothetical protein
MKHLTPLCGPHTHVLPSVIKDTCRPAGSLYCVLVVANIPTQTHPEPALKHLLPAPLSLPATCHRSLPRSIIGSGGPNLEQVLPAAWFNRTAFPYLLHLRLRGTIGSQALVGRVCETGEWKGW